MDTLFCNANCRDGFLADRQAGVIYPPGLVRAGEVPEGVTSTPKSGGMALIAWTDFCALEWTCAYCRADLPCCEAHQTARLTLADLTTLDGRRPFASHEAHPGKPAALACALAGVR